jgi:Xaa-Pro aminopeptidase
MFTITKNESEIFYEISYSNDNSLLLTDGVSNYLFTDGRYFEEAKSAAKNCEVILSQTLFKSAAGTIRKERIQKLFFDPKNITHFEHEELNRLSTAALYPKKGILSKKRVIKSGEELKKIKTAVKLGKKGFKKFAAKLSEIKKEPDEFELAYLAKECLTWRGSFEASFEPITAIDENGANPHARATAKKLKKGSLLLFDGGVKFERYCSDRTRTAYYQDGFEFKKKQSFKDKKLQHIYDTVLAAQEAAIEAARVGMKASELDGVARAVIEKAGYGEQFVHSLGHGVGLDIHEYPYISKKSDDILCENMVFTIEPGIYIPGHYGVRIEDMFVLTADGAEVL